MRTQITTLLATAWLGGNLAYAVDFGVGFDLSLEYGYEVLSCCT